MLYSTYSFGPCLHAYTIHTGLIPTGHLKLKTYKPKGKNPNGGLMAPVAEPSLKITIKIFTDFAIKNKNPKQKYFKFQCRQRYSIYCYIMFINFVSKFG